MGFPRILSKNNKIYTKLGEFCLSIGSNQFFIVCHTCQQELQTQDTFWKHIQDEHSFMHELRPESVSKVKTCFEEQKSYFCVPHQSEPNRIQSSQGYLDGADTAAVIDVAPPCAALVSQYRKTNIKAEYASAEGVATEAEEEADGDEDTEPKDYTEMRVIEPSAVEVNIKEEQSHIDNADSMNPQQHQQLQEPQQHQQELGPTNLYMPNTTAAAAVIPPHVMGYSSIFPNIAQVVCGAPPIAAVPNTVAAQEPQPRDSSSANSEDGERWYICDYNTCGLKFKYQSRLAMHSSVHSKERRFVCDMCNASFKQSCNLSTHRKKKHSVRIERK